MKTELRKVSTYAVCIDEDHFNEEIIKSLPNMRKDKKNRTWLFVDLIILSDLVALRVTSPKSKRVNYSQVP